MFVFRVFSLRHFEILAFESEDSKIQAKGIAFLTHNWEKFTCLWKSYGSEAIPMRSLTPQCSHSSEQTDTQFDLTYICLNPLYCYWFHKGFWNPLSCVRQGVELWHGLIFNTRNRQRHDQISYVVADSFGYLWLQILSNDVQHGWIQWWTLLTISS